MKVLSKSKRKRELATVVRMAFEMAGILISLGIQGVIIGSSSSGCQRRPTTIAPETTMYSIGPVFNDTVLTTDINSNSTKTDTKGGFFEEQKYFVAALVVVGILVALIILLLCGTKENLGIKFTISFFVKNT